MRPQSHRSLTCVLAVENHRPQGSCWQGTYSVPRAAVQLSRRPPGPEEPHPTSEEPPAARAAGTAAPGPNPHTPRQATASQLTFPWLSMPTKASEVQESCMALKWTAGPLARGRLMAGSSAERGVAEL